MSESQVKPCFISSMIDGVGSITALASSISPDVGTRA